jgi:uncharacterized membrane protein
VANGNQIESLQYYEDSFDEEEEENTTAQQVVEVLEEDLPEDEAGDNIEDIKIKMIALEKLQPQIVQ